MNFDAEIIKRIYATYGSESGTLFGLKADQKDVVKGIVNATLMFYEDIMTEEEKDNEDDEN